MAREPENGGVDINLPMRRLFSLLIITILTYHWFRVGTAKVNVGRILSPRQVVKVMVTKAA